MQHTATHCNRLQHTFGVRDASRAMMHQVRDKSSTHCYPLQHTATDRDQSRERYILDTLQHTATHCNTPWPLEWEIHPKDLTFSPLLSQGRGVCWEMYQRIASFLAYLSWSISLDLSLMMHLSHRGACSRERLETKDLTFSPLQEIHPRLPSGAKDLTFSPVLSLSRRDASSPSLYRMSYLLHTKFMFTFYKMKRRSNRHPPL